MKHKKPSAQHSTSKKTPAAFYVIAVCIPLVFFALLEAGLRVAGYGHSTPLFISNPANENYILPRPDVLARYFPNEETRPSVTLEANFLLREKPENGFRVFVQGGSTAAGFPYGLGASLAGALDMRLKKSMPGRYVEVINTAMSAVNSYTLLDLADEIIEQSPDAVFIYAGHNEYLGVLGVGSTYQTAASHSTTRWFLLLKELRLFQLAQDVVGLFRNTQISESGTDTPNGNRTFMAKVAQNREIAFDSDIYNAGLYQFTENMSDLIDKYQNANIPVFIATIASNLSHQAPFVSSSNGEESFGLMSRLSSHPDEFEKFSLSIMEIDNAQLHFEFAKLAEQNKMFPLARLHFELAKDFDRLRFRAPQQINDIIRTLANEPGVYLVESELAFEQMSPNGIVGESLMLEHLHPNLRGYFLLSESFYQTFKSANLVDKWRNIPIEQAWNERLVLPSEEYFGYATIKRLTSDYPFVDSPVEFTLAPPNDNVQSTGLAHFNNQIDWLTMIQQSNAFYQSENNKRMQRKAMQIIADALPHDGLANARMAEFFERQGEFNLAAIYYRRAKLAGYVMTGIDNKIERLFSMAERNY